MPEEEKDLDLIQVDTDDMINYIYMRLLDKGFAVSEEHIEMILDLESEYLMEIADLNEAEEE